MTSISPNHDLHQKWQHGDWFWFVHDLWRQYHTHYLINNNGSYGSSSAVFPTELLSVSEKHSLASFFIATITNHILCSILNSHLIDCRFNLIHLNVFDLMWHWMTSCGGFLYFRFLSGKLSHFVTRRPSHACIYMGLLKLTWLNGLTAATLWTHLSQMVRQIVSLAKSGEYLLKMS